MLDLLGKKITELDPATIQRINDLLVTVQDGVTKNMTKELFLAERLYLLGGNPTSLIGSPIEALDSEGNNIVMPPSKAWYLTSDTVISRVGGTGGGTPGVDHGFERKIVSFISDPAGNVVIGGSVVFPWQVLNGDFSGFATTWDDAGNAYPRLRYTGSLDRNFKIKTRVQIVEVDF